MNRIKDWDNISDDEIRIIGDRKSAKPSRRTWFITIFSILVVVTIGAVISIIIGREQSEDKIDVPTLFEPIAAASDIAPAEIVSELQESSVEGNLANTVSGYCEIRDTVINDVQLRLYIPRNARAMLHKGKLSKADTTIVYASQAADLRADNGGIVGAFVLKGEPLTWGLSKRGYCAIIDDVVTIGVADNSPLFERATEREGYFFRQYPLVDNRRLVDNKPKGKSYRRALCEQSGSVFVVHSLTKESFHDFAQALVDLGCDNAIYIMGSTSYGWAIDADSEIHEFGQEVLYEDDALIPKNINYIVWRR